MTWRHPFITIDQNQIRQVDVLTQLADECRREHWHILIPDGSFQEFAKGGLFYETSKRSLESLTPYRDLIFMARPMKALIREVLASREPSSTLIHQGTTNYLRSLLGNEHTIDRELRALADGPVRKLMPEALAAWNDHDESKYLLQGLHDAFKRDMPAPRLKSLRQQNESATSEWVSSIDGSRFVYKWLSEQNIDPVTALYLTREPNAAAGFASALAALAIDWIAMGGIESTESANLSSDFYDTEYVVLGALSRSLATNDRRAARICRAVVAGFETRRSASWLKAELEAS